MRALYVITAGAAAIVWASAGFSQELPVAPFTAAQADAGRQAFVQHCMVCHGDKLQGIGDAQKLVGKDFVDGSAGCDWAVFVLAKGRTPSPDEGIAFQ